MWIAIVALVGYVVWSRRGAQSSGDSSAADSTVTSLVGSVSDYAEQLEVSVQESQNPIVSNAISADPSTWPTGDRLWDVARAIAFAEGANVPGSNPDRLNNPGDISDGAHVYGSEFHSGSNITTFPDKETGWNTLYAKLRNIQLGISSSYSSSMTWIQFAQKYAGNWQNWVNNVTAQLGVDPNSTFDDYVSGAVS